MTATSSLAQPSNSAQTNVVPRVPEAAIRLGPAPTRQFLYLFTPLAFRVGAGVIGTALSPYHIAPKDFIVGAGLILIINTRWVILPQLFTLSGLVNGRWTIRLNTLFLRNFDLSIRYDRSYDWALDSSAQAIKVSSWLGFLAKPGRPTAVRVLHPDQLPGCSSNVRQFNVSAGPPPGWGWI
jgi:hypothetical protein